VFFFNLYPPPPRRIVDQNVTVSVRFASSFMIVSEALTSKHSNFIERRLLPVLRYDVTVVNIEINLFKHVAR